ncbi:hypothetical protein [Proteiniphilum sp. X52]|uniref:hypothetical protein n=1 Tax=Proteiniphilum sp. X52 TaxID=2382159 RepID=UPI00162AE681|nr:hypothetical protein [Proteiniphilum sp. X52]
MIPQMKMNGEAIYSSWPWRNANKSGNEQIALTQREDNLYLILKEWQQSPIIMPGLEQAAKVPNEITNQHLLKNKA